MNLTIRPAVRILGAAVLTLAGAGVMAFATVAPADAATHHGQRAD